MHGRISEADFLYIAGLNIMYLSFLILIGWLIYMFIAQQWYLFVSQWIMSLVMIGGSFIAGASAESGGAFAFPVMTLLLKFSPDVVRNFSLAIQSIGMTSASFFIFSKKIPIERNYLLLSTVGGAAGITIGTIFLSNVVSPDYLKMLFFSLWLSFAFVLFYLNQIKKRDVNECLPELSNSQKYVLIIMGFFGGILTSILGSGIDIFTFSYVTMRYNLSEKVATPTSVIIMAFNSILGFFLHFFIVNDIGANEFHLLMVCIPVVIFGAPLGVYFVNKVKRTQIAELLYIILTCQFIIACIFIRPRGNLLIFSIFIFIFGIIIFSFFGKVFLITAVFKKILIPGRFSGKTFAWDTHKTVGFDIGQGFWKNIISHKKIFIIIFFIWLVPVIVFTKGDILILIRSPIPILLLLISIFASVIANSTAAGGGMILLPALSLIFLEYLHVIDFARSYFFYQAYTLSGIVIAIHVTQSFGMLAGSISWWSSGVKILVKENILNAVGIIIGVIIGKYYWLLETYTVYKVFGAWNIIMFLVIIYNMIIVKNISTRTRWPGKLTWIFFFAGIAGGLVGAWTSIGVGSITSFIFILLLKPEISIANGSVMMALSSIITVVVHLLLKQSIPVEIVFFTVPAVLIGGYAAPFFSMWIGKKLYRALVRANASIEYNSYGTKINRNILEYTSGQLIMQISFIIVCLYNGLYYLFFK